MKVSQNLIIHTFFQYTKRPTFKKSAGTYNSECPYCHEGKSTGKKRRFFFIPEDELLYCHNCGASKSGYDFVKDMTGMSYAQMLAEGDLHIDTVEDVVKKTAIFKKNNPSTLPHDSINLFDSTQVSFYRENQVIKDGLQFIKKRRLDTAVNRPKALWLSLTDFTHRNRVVFPFYNINNTSKIDFYQSRAIYKQDEDIAKYLSKVNSDKGVFNLDRIDTNIEIIFLQEGPIDAMFLRNSVALAGIHPTEEQLDTITKTYPMHDLVYVLDNQWVDETSYEISKKLLQEGKNVFLWPEALKKYKDLNDICVEQKIDEVPYKFIVKNTFKGVKGILQYSQIKCKQS